MRTQGATAAETYFVVAVTDGGRVYRLEFRGEEAEARAAKCAGDAIVAGFDATLKKVLKGES